MNDKLILECARSLGWSPSWQSSEVKVERAVTAPFVGSKDLGEWWISQPRVTTVFRVTDNDLKVFNRDKKIKSLLKFWN